MKYSFTKIIRLFFAFFLIIYKVNYVKGKTFLTRKLIACEEGEYLSGTSCLKCKAGTYAPEGYNSCIPCQAGTYSTAGLSSCLSCPGGTYSL